MMLNSATIDEINNLPMSQLDRKRRRREAILEALRDGQDPEEIATITGLNSASIKAMTRPRPDYPRLTGEEIIARREARAAKVAAIVADLKADMTTGDASRKHGVSISYLSALRRRHNLPRSAPGSTKSLQTQEVIAALMGGARAPDLARKYGITKQRVSQIRLAALRAGIAVPRGRRGRQARSIVTTGAEP